jgi:hypothetical protein
MSPVCCTDKKCNQTFERKEKAPPLNLVVEQTATRGEGQKLHLMENLGWF